MRLQHLEVTGFKSFAKKSLLSFTVPVTAVVGPNGSGKSNVVEAFRFVLGEQSMKSMRGKNGSDLIFRGSNNTAKLSRAAVSVTFDNSDKVFAFQNGDGKSPLLFDTVTFTRELFADGTSRYLMNDTEIRLKQMVELLSSVNIGTSSHHIISQGEADSILRASTRDRRELLEDALGLKIYHYRIKESESKLTKATETLKEVQSLRRELAPHLTFLKKQVEKIEKGRAIRTELEGALVQYLATEALHLQREDATSRDAEDLIRRKKHDLEEKLADIPQEDTTPDVYGADLACARQALAGVREKRRSIESRISRLEGMIEVHRRMLADREQRALAHAQEVQSATITFAQTEYHQILNDIAFFIQQIREAKTIEASQQAVDTMAPLIERLRAREPKSASSEPVAATSSPEWTDTALELEGLERDLTHLVQEEETHQKELQTLETAREAYISATRSATKDRYELQTQINQCESELQILAVTKASFMARKDAFDTELKEAGFLFGTGFVHALQNTAGIPELDLHTLKRTIDRLKIRLDEHSGIGNDVAVEYENTVERDAFLAREVADIESSIRNLETVIVDLKKILDDKFTTGVAIINERFSEFFKTMFGGGSAFLSVTMEKKRKRKVEATLSDEELLDSEETDESEAMERGIDVHVNLPEKKVKELTMLSGGERSLVSIALLFAVSQVNPPPFLVLDETDAALDEANSRRYGDMIERLSAYSQLIVVTHNRETMSRASVLYGVTLGSDGASKLLSIKFDDAVKVAK